MGLDLCHVLSDPRHYGDFVCLICQSVIDLDALITTPCSHCFCKACLEEWVERTTLNAIQNGALYSGDSAATAPKCPTCSQDLLYSHQASKYQSMMIGSNTVTVQPLKTCQPLAYRVLKKIKVGCPLGKVGCTWAGDYGDLREHMLSKTAHVHCASSNDAMETNIPLKDESKIPAKKSSSKKHMQPPMMRIDDLEGGSQEMPELPFEKEEPVSKPKAVNILKIEDPNSRNINTQFTNTPKDGFEEAYQKPLSSRRSQGS